MSARFRITLLPLCALALALPRVSGQAQVVTDSAAAAILAPIASAPQTERGPTLRAAAVGVQYRSTPFEPAELQQRRNVGLGQAEAMMIVGGAAVLVGAVVGGDAGDIIMIGGAIIGLVGLYKYLQ